MRGLIVYELGRYIGGSKFIDQVHAAVSRYDDIQLVMKEDVSIVVDGPTSLSPCQTERL